MPRPAARPLVATRRPVPSRWQRHVNSFIKWVAAHTAAAATPAIAYGLRHDPWVVVNARPAQGRRVGAAQPRPTGGSMAADWLSSCRSLQTAGDQ
jgi:hypothetical protein